MLLGTEIDRVQFVYSAEEIKEHHPRFSGLPFVGYVPSPDHPNHNHLWNSLTNLAFRVLDLEPHLVVVYHSTNDAKTRWIHPDCFDGQTPIRGLSHGTWREEGSDLGSLVSYRYLGIGRGWIDNPIELNSWLYPLAQSDPDCYPPEDMTM